MKKLLERVKRLIFVPKCIFCGEVLPLSITVCLCEKCRAQAPFANDKICERCGKPIDMVQGDLICKTCRNEKRYFDKGISVFVYEEKPKQAIIRFKFYNKKSFARTLGSLLAQAIKDKLTDMEIDILTYVPLHPKRLRERGYHQTKMLAHYVSEICGLPMQEVLVKTHYTPPQRTLKAAERKQNIANSFWVALDIKGKSVLLIDDVYTTGITVNTCAKALKKAGAKQVLVATVAIGKDF
ncbi:MAG: ComF family protein [Hyphomonadaceae bacterium]|nr:ComF family protein [Clostridia bacterium]